MLLTNVFILALYMIQSIQEHYSCTTKIGVDATSRIEIGFTIGLCSMAIEMLNAHILLVYARHKLVRDREKWGLVAHIDLTIYQISLGLDRVFKLVNVIIAAALSYYHWIHVPVSCRDRLDRLLQEYTWAQAILCILILKTVLSLIWLQKLDKEIQSS